MSRELFSRSPDLQRLRDEGYFVQIRNGFLILREVPYLAAPGRIARGTLISPLTLTGDVAAPPENHTIHFDGAYPLDANGTQISAIAHQSQHVDLGGGLSAEHVFSCKPEAGYPDHYEKMTTYAGILTGPARSVDPEVTARVYRAAGDEEDSVFCYTDNASALAGIGALSERLQGERVGIVGTGGSGAYILDLVAKTPVRELRLFDPDVFKQHNAFRSPGAASLEDLRDAPLKVTYLSAIYSRMHRNIVPHPVRLSAENLSLLDGLTFAFLSMDAGPDKAAVVAYLEQMGASFIDVGMGLDLVDDSLGGILRVTTSTPARREHVHQGRVSFADAGQDIYASNIQVADLNALNGALAVHKWKKIRGFYRDLEHEHHSTFTTDGNQLCNSELP